MKSTNLSEAKVFHEIIIKIEKVHYITNWSYELFKNS